MFLLNKYKNKHSSLRWLGIGAVAPPSVHIHEQPPPGRPRADSCYHGDLKTEPAVHLIKTAKNINASKIISC